MNRRKLSVAGAVLMLLLALNLYQDIHRALSRYDWTRVERRELNKGIVSSGVMEGAKISEIKCEVDEQIEEIFVHEGQAVRVGQPLMRLSQTRTKIEFEQRRNALNNVETELRKAQRDVTVQKKLLKNLAVSRAQVEDAVHNVEKTTGDLEIARQEFKVAKNKLDGTLVKSPINGTVLKISGLLNAAVTNGKDLITVGDISKFLVRTKVDELDIQQIRPGQPVEITADAFANEHMSGVVKSIASQAEREAFAKIEVVADIIETNGLPLKHNLSVQLNIVTEKIPDALSVPIKAVVKKQGDFGWLVVRNRWGGLTQRKVLLGKTAGDRVEVREKISAGEEVGTEKIVEKE